MEALLKNCNLEPSNYSQGTSNRKQNGLQFQAVVSHKELDDSHRKSTRRSTEGAQKKSDETSREEVTVVKGVPQGRHVGRQHVHVCNLSQVVEATR